MTQHVLVLLFSLLILLAGGEALVRGASALARRLGVSTMVIGLTVVAFGTSAPELAVSMSSALRGSDAIAFGNVVGSNIGNIGFLLGVAAVMAPLTVDSTIVAREIPMMILASLALTVFSLDVWLDGASEGVLSRSDGIALLLFFCVFLYYIIASNLFGRGSNSTEDPLLEEVRREMPDRRASIWVTVALVIGGLIGLSLGGHLMVGAATSIARALGVGEVVIGVTLVALGTSLPELVTSIVAARRGEPDIAVANIVGSNIFNALFVIGATACVRPVQIAGGGAIDLTVMCVFALVLLLMAHTGGRRITRGEGALLLLGYAGYLAWQVIR